RGADTALGTASQIDVWSIAQGAVERVQSSSFVVAGMEIQTDSSTVFDGLAAANELKSGLPVAVWGLQAGADGNRWTATRVAVLAGDLSAVISTGVVSGTTAAQRVNGLPMAGPMAPKLIPQQLVRVEGPLADSSLRVDAYRVLDLPVNAASRGELEIEGVVTAVQAGGRFMLGNQQVDASSAKFDTTSSQVALGMRVEVHGTMQGQTLKALSVEVQSSQKLDRAEISAKIEQFTSLANFVVRGQRCNAAGATIAKGKASDLKVGIKVKVEGTKAGDVLLVTRLEIDD
ncbi:MAG: DUF5666 domain-containing protein, partial [Rhodoferax sp.]|nr:DUF5666 domain-containing protein [Rhodoferax sp.]